MGVIIIIFLQRVLDPSILLIRHLESSTSLSRERDHRERAVHTSARGQGSLLPKLHCLIPRLLHLIVLIKILHLHASLHRSICPGLNLLDPTGVYKEVKNPRAFRRINLQGAKSASSTGRYRELAGWQGRA